jgi:gamma-glutamylcyclotransferase (GGCT)/AIG2-like uncharacterized protein YtfP
MPNLFTYGSLMCSDIMYKVAGCRPDSVPASLKDFFRSRIRGEEYPGIILQPGSRVEGILYLDLPSPAMERLDRFEGEQYLRQEVQVSTERHGLCAAATYVIHPQHKDILTGEPWSYEHFLATGKTRFLSAYLGFREIPPGSAEEYS